MDSCKSNTLISIGEMANEKAQGPTFREAGLRSIAWGLLIGLVIPFIFTTDSSFFVFQRQNPAYNIGVILFLLGICLAVFRIVVMGVYRVPVHTKSMGITFFLMALMWFIIVILM